MSPPDVSVVVCHYEQPGLLALVLAALAAQTLPADRFEVVVADDGSAVPPEPGPQPYPVRVVTQADRGFRAAAARNRGVRASTGRFVQFLDADTIPEPGYLAEVLAVADELGEALVVGRRRHADLAGMSPEALLDWFAGRADPPEELTEPAWLQEGFDRTDDLREADDESYRYVIGAVLGVHRSVLDRAGWWDERFDEYGGEDWELAHRCWLAGAAFRHVRTAVAWHDGVDFAGRDLDRVRVQNGQAMALARLLPSPATRPPGLVWEYPQVAAEVDDRGWTHEQRLLVVASLLAGSDAGVWLREGDTPGPWQDPRVRVGPVPADVAQRARYRVEVREPVELPAPLADLVGRAPLDTPALTVRHARQVHDVRWTAADAGPTDDEHGLRSVEPTPSLGGLLRSRAEQADGPGSG